MLAHLLYSRFSIRKLCFFFLKRGNRFQMKLFTLTPGKEKDNDQFSQNSCFATLLMVQFSTPWEVIIQCNINVSSTKKHRAIFSCNCFYSFLRRYKTLMLAINIWKLLAFVVCLLINSCYLSTFPMYRARCALGIKSVYS